MDVTKGDCDMVRAPSSSNSFEKLMDVLPAAVTGEVLRVSQRTAVGGRELGMRRSGFNGGRSFKIGCNTE